jgi:hypothetical protein
MDRWDSVCDLAPARVATVAGFLMTDDSFRLSVDDLLGRMVDMRRELHDTDFESSPRKRTRADDCLLLGQLKVCDSQHLCDESARFI